ncbi:unnamed protein product [Pleuronectes platessa]|uniref:Uncharacterized protein n=1 Tax=Pleuronectes platessa TaxID=8262 RepID=A0A9N7ZDA8_PLEPL|nr:unnamed protein product [Pleuronectes platessa]
MSHSTQKKTHRELGLEGHCVNTPSSLWSCSFLSHSLSPGYSLKAAAARTNVDESKHKEVRGLRTFILTAPLDLISCCEDKSASNGNTTRIDVIVGLHGIDGGGDLAEEETRVNYEPQHPPQLEAAGVSWGASRGGALTSRGAG